MSIIAWRALGILFLLNCLISYGFVFSEIISTGELHNTDFLLLASFLGILFALNIPNCEFKCLKDKQKEVD